MKEEKNSKINEVTFRDIFSALKSVIIHFNDSESSCWLIRFLKKAATFLIRVMKKI